MKPLPRPKRIVLIFLGKKGGGAQVVYSLLRDLKLTEIEVWVSKDFDTSPVESTMKIKYRVFDVPHQFKNLCRPSLILRSMASLINMLVVSIISNQTLFVQLMPSPTDVLVDFGAKIRKNEIVRLIHDGEPHLGEMWPSKGAIIRRVRSADHVIVFSKHVASLVQEFYTRETLLCALPTLHYESNYGTSVSQEIQDIFVETNVPIILFIGRILEYKGLGGFLTELDEVEVPYRFVIAGEGKLPSAIEHCSKHIVLNRWLNDAEFNFALNRSDIIAFPYVEASQSGIIPIARNKSKIILSTNVGGISEQLQNYNKSFLVSRITKFEIEKALDSVRKFSEIRSSLTSPYKGVEVYVALESLI